MLLESYFVASHSTFLILIRPEKYMLSLQEEYVSVGISNVRNDWNWAVWNGNFSYSWNLKDDSFLSRVHSHYLSEFRLWFTSLTSKMDKPDFFQATASHPLCLLLLQPLPNTCTATFCLSYISQLNFHHGFLFCFFFFAHPAKFRMYALGKLGIQRRNHMCIHAINTVWKLFGFFFLAGLY